MPGAPRPARLGAAQRGSARFGADRAARPRAGHDVAISYHELPVDQDMPDAGRRARAMPVAGLIGDGGRVEHHDFGVAARPETALSAQGGHPFALSEALAKCSLEPARL